MIDITLANQWFQGRSGNTRASTGRETTLTKSIFIFSLEYESLNPDIYRCPVFIKNNMDTKDIMEIIIEGLLWYGVFIFSTTCHEAAHAFASLKLGDKTAYEGGQVTLDPIPHIRREPVGTIVFPWLSFFMGGWMIGWASAPYDPIWAMRFPKRSALMSLAGPLSNLVIVVISVIFIRLGIMCDVFYEPDLVNFSRITEAANPGIFEGVAKILSILFSLNLILCFFNLLPLPPLDGSGVIPMFLSEDMARKYMDIIHNQVFSFLGLMLAWKVFDYVFDPIHLFAINLLYPGGGYQ